MEEYVRDWVRGLKLFSMLLLILISSALPIGIVDWVLRHLFGRSFLTIIVIIAVWPFLFGRISKMIGVRLDEQTPPSKPGLRRSLSK